MLLITACHASPGGSSETVQNDAPTAADEATPANSPGNASDSAEGEAAAPAANGAASDGGAKPEDVGACRVQDGEAIPGNALKAVGTEPFWGARIEGRCVTYSTPENQQGTRVWTTFSGTREAGTWKGAYQGQPFVLRTSSEAGCSDGMSDKHYPLAVSVTVAGEERRGCAEPL